MIKAEFPCITDVHLRSDGAGNFKCKESILAMPLLFEHTGIRVRSFRVSEAGNGKGPTDGHFQKLKQLIAEAKRLEKTSVRTGAELLELLQTGLEQTGVSGTGAVVQLHLDRDQQPSKSSKEIVGIRSYYLFTYEWDGPGGAFSGMRCFTFDGIGEGKFFSAEDVKLMRGFEYEDFDAVLTRSTNASLLGIAASEIKTKSVIKSDAHRSEAFKSMVAKRLAKAEKPSRDQLLEETLWAGAQSRGALRCKHCKSKSMWLSHKRHREHESECEAAATAKAANTNFKPLGDARQLLNANVQKGESDVGVEYILPTKVNSLIDPDAPYLLGTQAGWGLRDVARGKGGFSAEVKEFLLECYNAKNKLQPKVVENMMKAKFNSTYETHHPDP